MSFIVSPCIYPLYRPSPPYPFYKKNIVSIDSHNGIDFVESLTPPSGGELKLLTHLNGAAWAQNWLLHMGRNDTQLYDEHY